MGQYKVPQDVEAEDKIIGPLTLRQFIYAVIGVMWAGLSFALLKSVPFLMILVGAPPTIVLMLLAFYKRDGQDFEHFLIALTSFFGQSRQRFWIKEPVVEAFKITPPKVTSSESQRNPAEVRSQLDRLAGVMDSRGGLDQLERGSDDRLFMPEQPTTETAGGDNEVDILDPQQNPSILNVSQLIEQTAEHMRSATIQRLRDQAANPAPAAPVVAVPSAQSLPAASTPTPITPSAPSASVMTAPISGDIIRLATENDDLKVSQIAAQAGRMAPIAEGESVKLRDATSPQ